MKHKILFLFLLFNSAISGGDFTLVKNSKCKIFVKPSERSLAVNWHGQCKNGFADGLGVARYLKNSKVESVFFGIMKAGFWDFGVLDKQTGYVAGRFEKNEPVEIKDSNGVSDRNVTLKAFVTASKAATQLSEEFEKLGNKESAKHYKAEANKLSQQMD